MNLINYPFALVGYLAYEGSTPVDIEQLFIDQP